MNDFKFDEIADLFTGKLEHIPDRESCVNADPKCIVCGSTSLIKISDYHKALPFLANAAGNLQSQKIRLQHSSGKGEVSTEMWCCLDCQNLKNQS
jgi:hypothetical protein